MPAPLYYSRPKVILSHLTLFLSETQVFTILLPVSPGDKIETPAIVLIKVLAVPQE
jgi:hypothetical protein